MTLLQVTMRIADNAFPETYTTKVDDSLSVADMKRMFLRRFHLEDIMSVDQVLLLFRPTASLDLKFTHASRPYSLENTHLSIVEDEAKLGRFLQRPTLIAFALFSG